MTELFVIVNGRLRNGRFRKRWNTILSRLHDGFRGRLEVCYTTGKGDATLQAREALAAGIPWLAAAGGDGTIHEVVNGYFECGRNIAPETPLSFLPCGSGNDWARTLGLPASPKAIVEGLMASRVCSVDVGLAQYRSRLGEVLERVFLNIAEAGVGAAVVDSFSRDSGCDPGRTGYMLRGLAAALSYSPHHIELTVDDGDLLLSGPLISLIIAGGRYFGAGMHCAPMARPDDGRLEVIAIGEFGKIELLCKFGRFVRGTYLNESKVTHRRVRSVRASTVEEVLLELDGELAGVLPASFVVIPRALKVRY